MSPPLRPLPKLGPAELLRIVASMTVACLVGAAVLGAVFMATDRYRAAAVLRGERTAIRDMLALDSTATLVEVRQFLAPERRLVVYRAAPLGAEGAPGHEAAFTLDGRLAEERDVPGGAPLAEGLVPLGRMFVAKRAGVPAGFVVEGESRGFKKRIRLFVALRPDFSVADMRVIEHEEDPGLGAEVATPWFRGQFVDRSAEEVAKLDVTKDPMPEDWRAALLAMAKRSPGGTARHAALLPRERAKPIYAVTGATISSRAVTDGVRATVDHFRRRWALLEPHLGRLR